VLSGPIAYHRVIVVENPYKFTREAQDAACRAMALTGNRHAAASAAGVSLVTVNRAASSDPDFRERLDEAKAQYVRTLEAEAHRRAVEGYDEQKCGPGGTLYSVTKYSDPLLLHLLKRKAPEEHGDSVRVDQRVTGEIGLSALSHESRELLRKILEREADGHQEEDQ
jgi:hypothetical protein